MINDPPRAGGRSGPIALERARQLVGDSCAPLDSESVSVDAAHGRVLAAAVVSTAPVPGFDSSSMDGFAVRAGDTRGASRGAPLTLAVAGESRAGSPSYERLAPGEAIAISTGAVMPEGADSVIRIEDTRRLEAGVRIEVEASVGDNLRRAGSDVGPGEQLLGEGDRIGALELAMVVALGRDRVDCHRRPRVGVLSSGDELLEPGDAPRPGAIFDANGHSLAALVESCGARVTARATVPDRALATRAAIEAALDADIVVISGGVSVGEHDHVRPALRELGAEEVFWGVALRPGKPTWFGVGPGGPLIFGLPGNPVSAIVTFLLFVRPAILALSGQGSDPPGSIGALDGPVLPTADRQSAVRCSRRLAADGWHLIPTGEQSSHRLSSMLGADSLAILPAGTEPIEAGTRVEFETLPDAIAGRM